MTPYMNLCGFSRYARRWARNQRKESIITCMTKSCEAVQEVGRTWIIEITDSNAKSRLTSLVFKTISSKTWGLTLDFLLFLLDKLPGTHFDLACMSSARYQSTMIKSLLVVTQPGHSRFCKNKCFIRNSSSVIHKPCRSQRGHVSRILTLITYAALLKQFLTWFILKTTKIIIADCLK